jgi:5-methylcytosine-specific restriction endonuclease McrA
LARARFTFDYVYTYFKEQGCELLEREYVNNSTRMKFRCKCGNDKYSISFATFKKGARCDLCKKEKLSNANRKYDLEQVQKIFKERGCILLENEYRNTKHPMRYICKCGNSHMIDLDHFIYQKSSCPECKKQAIRDAQWESKEVDCANCGKQIIRQPYRIQRNSEHFCSDECKGSWYRHALLGEGNPNWNEDLSLEERLRGRKYPEYYEWRILVYRRDNHKCVLCSSKKNIVAHHLDGYHWAKEKRTDVDNGITLCEECHGAFHREYGRINNTREQFNEWIRNKRKQDAI